MIREPMQYGKRSGLVNHHCLVLASSGQLRTIVREFQIPDLIRVTIKFQHCPQRKVISVTHMISVKRGRHSSVVVETVVYLTLLYLIQEMCKPVLRNHYRWGY
jgi:hypothetical protein